MTSLEQVIVQLLVVGCTSLDPSPDDEDLATLKKGTAKRHSGPDDARRALKFLDQIAGIWVVGEHARCRRFEPARDVEEVVVRDRRTQVETAPVQRGVVTVCTGRTPGGIAGTEDVLLNAAE